MNVQEICVDYLQTTPYLPGEAAITTRLRIPEAVKGLECDVVSVAFSPGTD
jgi:hypothetical protein